jgi:hypothetical protein
MFSNIRWRLSLSLIDCRYGKCDGDARAANFVRRKDSNGIERVYGSISVGDQICQMSPNAGGADEINCTPLSEFRDHEEPVEVPQNRNLRVGYHPTSSLTNATHSMRGSAGRINIDFGEGRRLYDDSGSTIDVLVVWTNEAECKTSKLAKTCTRNATTESNMRGLIDLAVFETNTAFNLSGINTQLRLVHAYRDPTYVEPTTAVFNTVLTNLKATSDGKLDSVHAKRTLYGADAVAMIIGKSLLPKIFGYTVAQHSDARFPQLRVRLQLMLGLVALVILEQSRLMRFQSRVARVRQVTIRSATKSRTI